MSFLGVLVSRYADEATFAKLKNKRSKDLGALLDSCSWDDVGNFL